APEHQAADSDERHRRRIRRRSEEADHAVDEPTADEPPAPAEVEHAREEDAERREDEADELRVLAPTATAGALALPDPRRRPRLDGASLPAARHAGVLRRGSGQPCLDICRRTRDGGAARRTAPARPPPALIVTLAKRRRAS